MDFPNEIWLKIAHYLSLGDKAASAQVCKSWNEIFISQLYYTVDLRPDRKPQKETAPEDGDPETLSTTGSSDGNTPDELPLPRELLQKYSHLIRELILCFPCPYPYLWELTPAINCLAALYLDSPEGEENLTYNPLDRRGLSHLLINNPQIRTVSFQHLNFDGASRLFRQVARHCAHLQFLYVFDSFFKFEDMELTLEKNQGLRRFFFSNDNRYYIFDTPAPEEWEDPMARLGTLSIAHIENDVNSLDSTQLQELLRSIHITHLNIVDSNSEHVDEEDLASMFFFWPDVVNYRLVYKSFGFRSMNALGHHFDHLRTLDVCRSFHFKNWMYEIVLAACPQLVSLGVCVLDLNSLFDEDREEGKSAAVVIVMQRLQIKVNNVSLHSWACAGLQDFKAVRLIWPRTIKKQKRATRHLMELKHLKSFYVQEVIVNPEDSETIEGHAQVFWKQGRFSRLQLERDMETKWMTNVWPNMQSFKMLSSSFSSVVSNTVDY